MVYTGLLAGAISPASQLAGINLLIATVTAVERRHIVQARRDAKRRHPAEAENRSDPASNRSKRSNRQRSKICLGSSRTWERKDETPNTSRCHHGDGRHATEGLWATLAPTANHPYRISSVLGLCCSLRTCSSGARIANLPGVIYNTGDFRRRERTRIIMYTDCNYV
jgi:hypothetical protein